MPDRLNIIRRDGHDYIQLSDNRWVPTIAGGRKEGGEGGEGNGGEGGGGGELKETYSKEEVASMISKFNKTIQGLDQRLTESESQFQELVDAISEAVGEGGGEGEEEEEEEEEKEEKGVKSRGNDNEEVAGLKRQLQKMTRQMEEMQKTIQQREEAAEEERELRLASQRDQMLTQALQEAGVLTNAIDAGLKLFRDNVVYDDEKDQFFFEEDKTGVKLDILEGVKDNLPDYLKASSVKSGGSGGKGSQVHAALQSARDNLTALHEKAKKSGSEADIAAYHASKKQVIEMEKQGGSSAGTGKSAAPVGAGVRRGGQQTREGGEEE